MTTTALLDELAEMTSAKNFLNCFFIAFDPAVVQVNRLHILKRFHDYLRQTSPTDWDGYAGCLKQAYQDFVHSNAQTEKVFKVFHRQAAQREVRIAVADIGRTAS